jgi:hypothetical protein
MKKRTYLTDDGYDGNPTWVKLYKGFNSCFYVEKAGYFDERPLVRTGLTQLIVLLAMPFIVWQSWWFLLMIPFVFFGWGRIYLYLPIKTGIQDCESAAWGFNYHSNIMWFYIGGGGNFEGGKKWKTIHMPWELEWVRTSTLLADEKTWFHERKGSTCHQKKDGEYGSYEWLKQNSWVGEYPFTDPYDGAVLTARIKLKEMEHRYKGLKWIPIFRKIRKYIDIDFSQEVGTEKGSWKGGTIGIGETLLPGETPLECLRRVEKTRKF